jgi:hypothetical protein
MELARLVKRCIEGILILFAPLTIAGSPRASLISCRPLGASRSLGELLHVVKPQVDV